MTAPEPDAAGAPAPTIREVFDRERERLAREWEAKHDSEAYLRAHTSVLDTAVLAMLAESGLPADRIAVAAVGGYGRGELYPYSDIDLLVLTDESVKEDESCQTALATFTTRLWELGLTVGASVRSTSEFLSEAAEDVSIATTYLESRCLWGNGRLYAQARMHFAQTLDPRRFFRDKMLELARRHQKFEDTPYSLEPNIKESPGGLRDLQVFLWCAQAAGIRTVRLRHGLRRPHHRARDAYARRLRAPSRVASHHAASAHTPSGKPSALRRAGGACERTRLQRHGTAEALRGFDEALLPQCQGRRADVGHSASGNRRPSVRQLRQRARRQARGRVRRSRRRRWTSPETTSSGPIPTRC